MIFWWHRLQIRKARQILPQKHLPRCVGRNPNGDACGGAGRCGGTGAGVRLATKASRADPEGVAGTHTPHSRRRTLDWGIDGGCLGWSFAGVGCRKTPRAAPGGGARGAETPLAKPISHLLVPILKSQPHAATSACETSREPIGTRFQRPPWQNVLEPRGRLHSWRTTPYCRPRPSRHPTHKKPIRRLKMAPGAAHPAGRAPCRTSVRAWALDVLKTSYGT